MAYRTEGQILESPALAAAPTMCSLIDDAIVHFQGRSLVSGNEVVDFLLDLRSAVDAAERLEHVRACVPI